MLTKKNPSNISIITITAIDFTVYNCIIKITIHRNVGLLSKGH